MRNEMTRLIIGFGSKRQSGKDTAAQFAAYALQQAGFNTVTIALADKVKEVSALLFGLSHSDMNTEEGKSAYNDVWKMTNRQLLQGVGEGLRKSVHSEIWIKVLQRVMLKEIWSTVILVPDIRYLNEVAALRSQGAKLIQISRPDAIDRTKTEDKHASETELDNHPECWNYIIDNSGSLSDLDGAVASTVKQIVTSDRK